MNFDAFIQSEKEVMVLFYADWYAPAISQKRLLENEVNHECIAFIDVDIELELTERFKIKAVPTFMKFLKGEVTFRSI